MGKGETPARVRAVLLPPRPVARAVHPLAPELTQLRSREKGIGYAEALAPDADTDEVRVVPVGEPLVAPAMAAAPGAEIEPANSLPAVAPRSAPSRPQHLIECRVSVVPHLPIVALEQPSSSWPDLTPSPVPRVSLVPPTGRIDPSQLPGAEPRYVPTLAPRLRIASPTPAVTLPRLGSTTRAGRLLRRLLRDLRSSKREIVFGLGIGLGLSFALGKLGQKYLERRATGSPAAIESWTASALPTPEPRPTSTPNAAAVNPGVASSGAVNPAAASAASSNPAIARGAALQAAAPPSARAASSGTSTQQGTAKQEAGFEPARAASAPAPRSSKAPRRRAAASAGPADLPPIDANPWGEPAPAGAPREAAPLSPSESAGLGHELPL